MAQEELPRLDTYPEIHERILPLCRLGAGGVWKDPRGLHRVAVLDASDAAQMRRFYDGERARLALHDPPYNIRLGSKHSSSLSNGDVEGYIDFSRKWITAAVDALEEDAHFYLWTGADQKQGFQPLPELILLLREFEQLQSRSLITMRNQRGYGTQKNWMATRQELLYYTKGEPLFEVQYTDIPKILRGYYKEVGGTRTENSERGRSQTIRPGNVWVDIQQVFYRMEENVPGTYAQKPLKAAERVIAASSTPGETVADHFAHSGTTLIAAERLGRRCITCDIDPVFAEISIRRLERYRETGKTGWQWHTPFPELGSL